MAAHPHPTALRALARAVGALGATAHSAEADLLDSLAVLGDHAAQRACDDAVDAVVAALREVAVEGDELSLVLGAQAGSAADLPSEDRTALRGGR